MANRYTPLRTYKARTSEIFSAIESERQWSKLLDGQNKVYQPLLDVLIKNELEFLSIKEMTFYLNVNQSKVTKWVNMIYNDIWTLNEEQPELFLKSGCRLVDINFQGTYYGPSVFFTLSLPVIPGYGDAFNWHFIRPKLGSNYFYVESIHHYYEQGEMKTSLHLQEGIFNRYRHHVLDKADFLELLTFDERYYLPKHKLDELLVERTKDASDYEYLRRVSQRALFKNLK